MNRRASSSSSSDGENTKANNNAAVSVHDQNSLLSTIATLGTRSNEKASKAATATETLNVRSKSATACEECCGGGGGSGKPSGKIKVLPEPIISPRDKGLYRIIQLENGLKAVLVSTCAYGLQRARELDKEKTDCENAKVASVFERRGQKGIDDKRAAGNAKAKSKKNVCTIDDHIDAFDKIFAAATEDMGSLINKMSNFVSFMYQGSEDKIPDDVAKYLESGAVIKDEADSRLMKKACEIMNGLRSNDVSIALTVGCGSINDSEDMQGIAKLASDVVTESINSNRKGWRYYGYTSDETTTFQSNSSQNAKDPLKSLADGLSDLTIAEDSVFIYEIDLMDFIKEIVQCLFCWNAPIEDPRRLTLLYSLAKVDHPVRAISVEGNSPQLWNAIRADGPTDESDEQLLKSTVDEFLRQNYKPDLMTLFVKAPESLDNLQALVHEYFSKLVQSQTETELPETVDKNDETTQNQKKEEDVDPFNTEEFRKLYHVECVNTRCCGNGNAFVVITWALPPELGKEFLTKPLDYIRQLVMNEEHGGLIYNLRKKNLASLLDCSILNNKYFSLFQIQCDLFDKGLNDIRQLLGHVQGYLQFLNSAGSNLELFNDLQTAKAIEFHALDQPVNVNYPFPLSGTELSVSLQSYRPQELLIGPGLVRQYNSALIQQCLTELAALSKANIMLFTCKADALKSPDISDYFSEPIYGTKYRIQELPEVDNQGSGLYSLPKPNIWFDKAVCTLSAATDERIVMLDDGVEKPYVVWYQSKNNYTNSAYMVHIISTYAYGGSILSALRKIWCSMLMDELNASLYPGLEAGVNYFVKPTHCGILIYVNSWNRHAPDVLRTALETIMKFDTIDNEVFQRKKENLLKHYAALMKSEYLSDWYMSRNAYEAVTGMESYVLPLIHAELKIITPRHLEVFLIRIKANASCIGFAYGNVTRDHAESVADMIENVVKPRVTFDHFGIRKNVVPTGEKILRFKSFVKSKWVHLTNYYQCGRANPKKHMIAKLVVEMLWPFLWKESMALTNGKFYYLYPELIEDQGVVTIAVTAYGNSTTKLEDFNDTIDQALEKFFTDSLKRYNEADFNSRKKDLLKGLSSSGVTEYDDKDLIEVYFSMQDLTIRFSDRQCKIKELKAINLDDIKCWYKNHLIEEKESSCNFRKISVQISPKADVEASCKASQKTSESELNPPKPRTIQEWRTQRKQLRVCSFIDTYQYFEQHKNPLNETFAFKLEPDPDAKADEKCSNEYFITDIFKLKTALFQFPRQVDYN